MQRLIKFRAWDREAEVMALKIWCRTDGPEETDLNENIEDAASRYVLMQFTGKGVVGGDLYEGDIVSWTDSQDLDGVQCERRGFVLYHEQYCAFRVAWKDNLKSYLEQNFYGTARFLEPRHEVGESDLRIIGNIYQNPELLNENPPQKMMSAKGA